MILEQLQVDYLDLLLIHWPAAQGEPMVWQAQNAGTWRAFEKIYKAGAVRAIGVSNFLPHHLVPLLARAKVKPMVNQLEIHPGYPQRAALRFCMDHGILVQAWSPLGRGTLLRHPTLENCRRPRRHACAGCASLVPRARHCPDSEGHGLPPPEGRSRHFRIPAHA
ncbi:MAG: aldo/keto reductase [Sutterella seckii]